MSFAPVSFLFLLLLLGILVQLARAAVLQLRAAVLELRATILINPNAHTLLNKQTVDPNIVFSKDLTAKGATGEVNLDTKGDQNIQLVKIQPNWRRNSEADTNRKVASFFLL